MASSEIFPGITSDPRVLGGETVITGTRIPVALLLSHLASGMSVDEIAYEYDLVKEQIYAALAYAARRIEEDRITHPKTPSPHFPPQ
jgi:uncharacterized protein (DUF433 family)